MFYFYLWGHILLDTPRLNKADQSGKGDQGMGDAKDSWGEAPPWMLPNPSDMGHTVPETGWQLIGKSCSHMTAKPVPGSQLLVCLLGGRTIMPHSSFWSTSWCFLVEKKEKVAEKIYTASVLTAKGPRITQDGRLWVTQQSSHLNLGSSAWQMVSAGRKKCLQSKCLRVVWTCLSH